MLPSPSVASYSSNVMLHNTMSRLFGFKCRRGRTQRYSFAVILPRNLERAFKSGQWIVPLIAFSVRLPTIRLIVKVSPPFEMENVRNNNESKIEQEFYLDSEVSLTNPLGPSHKQLR